ERVTENARVVADFLRQRGASFFADIVRATGRLKAEVETALWELVAAGLVTADGFQNLRALISPDRRTVPGAPKLMRPRHSTGRCSMLSKPPTATKLSKPLARCCCGVTEWSFVRCWHANPTFRNGASC